MLKRLNYIPRFLTTAVVFAAILYFTLFPKPIGLDELPMFPGVDKVVHCIMFFALAASVHFDCARMVMFRKRRQDYVPVVSFVVASVVGGLIEIVQHVMHMGRSADAIDWAADCLGAAIGAVVMIYLMPRIQQAE